MQLKRSLLACLVMVSSLAFASFAAALSGSWAATVGIWPGLGVVAVQSPSELILTYTVGDWSFSSDTQFDVAGWTSQEFKADGSISALAIDSVLTFDPAHAAFSNWRVTGTLSVAGATLGGRLTVWANGTWFDTWISSTTGPVSVSAYLYLGEGGGCSLSFYSASLVVGFPLSCAAVQSIVSFHSQGLDYAQFEASDIAIPNLPWLSFDALLVLKPSQKAFELAPVLNFGTTDCITVYISGAGLGSLSPAPLTAASLSLDGFGLQCTIGDVEFSELSYFGTGTKPGILKNTWYQEACQIKAKSETCCGPIELDAAVYCLPDGTFPWSIMPSGTGLFGVDEIRAEASVAAGKRLTISLTVDVLPVWAPVLMSWEIGFKVVW